MRKNWTFNVNRFPKRISRLSYLVTKAVRTTELILPLNLNEDDQNGY